MIINMIIWYWKQTSISFKTIIFQALIQIRWNLILNYWIPNNFCPISSYSIYIILLCSYYFFWKGSSSENIFSKLGFLTDFNSKTYINDSIDIIKTQKTLSTNIQFELNSVYYSYNSIVSINNKRAL